MTICNSKGFHFTWWKIIHNLNNLLTISDTNKHIILIFEDMTQFINNTDSKLNSLMIDFLFRSRHSNISILSIMHGIRHALIKRNSFERIFLDNCSCFVIFKPITNKKVMYSYIGNLLDKSTCNKLDEIFDFISNHSTYPYILIQPHKNVNNDISKIRSDIFNNNWYFQSGI